MTKPETLEWIEVILDSLDEYEIMTLIKESAGQFDGEFFGTMGEEIARYKDEGQTATSDRLERIARAIASVRQNRAENL